MDLKNLVLRGFSTSELCRGGDEKTQCPKWLAAKNQAILLDRLRRLYMDVSTIDADESLSDVGRAKRKTEVAQKALAETEAESARLRTLIETKGGTAQSRLARASHAGESDIDRLARLLTVQNQQRFLMDLDGQALLGELARAVKDGDSTTYEAVTSLPTFVLRAKGITKEVVDASRREMSRRVDPSAAADVESAEIMARLVAEDLATAQRVVREHCGLPEENKVRTL